MATEIVPLAPELLPAVRRFGERVWRRPRSDAFYRWRYTDSASFHVGRLAMRDGECLAMECAIRRPWRVDGERVDVLEVFDWYCLPELRNAGLGVRVMQALMQEPHPLMLVGGSEDTQGLLPRLRWQVVGEAERWVLPLGVGRLADALGQRLPLGPRLARLAARVALARPGSRPRRRRVPAGGRALAVSRVGEEALALYHRPSPYRTVPTWTPELLGWLLGGFAALGHFVPLYYACGDRLVGWALLRVLPTLHGCDAELIECFAPEPEANLYTWMVSEAAVVAAGFRPGVIGAQTTCPLLAEALRRNSFVRSATNLVQLWWPGRNSLPGPMAIASNTGDGPLVPWATTWWDASQRPTGSQ